MPIQEPYQSLTKDQFIEGLQRLDSDSRITPLQRDILICQYASPYHAQTSGRLAGLLGIRHHMGINGSYASLGHKIVTILGIDPPYRTDGSEQRWGVLSTGHHTPEGYVWTMRPELVAALDSLGWISSALPEIPYPDDISDDAMPVEEGAVRQVLVNNYERSAFLRHECISRYGCRCHVCGFDFEAIYGAHGANYIHVHHEIPLASIGHSHRVDPASDMKPVCPNCHAMIHRHDPMLSIDELKDIIRQQRSPDSNEGSTP